MMLGSTCNGVYSCGSLDYAYLSLNVYNNREDLKLLGFKLYEFRLGLTDNAFQNWELSDQV